MRYKFFTFLFLVFTAKLIFSQVPFTYIEIDDARGKWGDYDQPGWLRYFGLDASDVNGNGYLDIVSGRYFYLNPGGDMTGEWVRTDLGFNVDGCLFVDVDGDMYADIIAMKYPQVLWLEAENLNGTSWKATEIARLPKTGHTNGQGYARADINNNGREEVLLAAGDGIYCIRISMEESKPTFTTTRIIETYSDEGFAVVDINQNGLPDIVFSDAADQEDREMPNILKVSYNPGHTDGLWESSVIGHTRYAIDRIRAADMNHNGIVDIVVSEERYPGEDPDASLYLFEGKLNGNNLSWERKTIVTQYSMNSMDIGDVDLDGHIDIVVNEHKGDRHQTQVWYNDGVGNFTMQLVDTGKEMHLGAKLFDMDNDGDLDIIGHAWENEQYLHLWRNDLRERPNNWTHLSSSKGDLPVPNQGNQQTSAGLLDMDKSGTMEIFISERTTSPSLVAYRYNGSGWDRYIIDNQPLRIEAGFAFTDIDGDGYDDIIFGGDSRSNEVWWWRNPYPDYDPDVPWERFTIKKSGATKHHDIIADDFTGDGKHEVVFWNQGAGKLYMARIPESPMDVDEWDYHAIYTYHTDSEMIQRGHGYYPGWKGINEHEGLYAYDIDGDGVKNIVGGGRWFRYDGEGGFEEHIIDAGYTFTRVVAGDFIEGGRPEVVMLAGDGHAPLLMYEYQDGTWIPRELIKRVFDGHTLQVIDFNGNGHLDILVGEMRINGANPDAVIKILLGDGKGNFTHQTVATGLGIHEGRMGDLNGNGKLDILVKPYNWEAPRLDILLNDN